MKCAEVQKDIYLFNELDRHQQEVIIGHVSGCASCTRVFDEAGHSRKLIQGVATATPMLQDSNKFTNQVMRSIRAEKQVSRRPSFVDALVQYLSLRSVKYSMAGLSIIFIGFFMSEYMQGSGPRQARMVTTTPVSTVKLNTASFFQRFQKVKTEGHAEKSISQCLIDCRHTPKMDCSSCKTKFLNIIKHHEKI